MVKVGTDSLLLSPNWCRQITMHSHKLVVVFTFVLTTFQFKYSRLAFCMVACILAQQRQRLRRMSYGNHFPSIIHPSFFVIIHPHFQTTSALKPLGQFLSDFMWSLLGSREQKIARVVLVHQPRWLLCIYDKKPVKIFFKIKSALVLNPCI